jgi:polysaccharide deacetylase family protein (PEP-CTERM system associated)
LSDNHYYHYRGEDFFEIARAKDSMLCFWREETSPSIELKRGKMKGYRPMKIPNALFDLDQASVQSLPIRVQARAADIFTVDVEDWFHILEVKDAPNLADWEKLPSRVERNFKELLELLAISNVKATCFVLGWIASHFPGLIREAADLGHEIASHGYGHQVVTGLSREQFRADINAAKRTIEDATGLPVRGYRAPGFSITAATPWAFEEIASAGHTFDSSIFPARHGHGGIPEAPRHPFIIQTLAGPLFEFPISLANTPLGWQCFFGGGYLRLAPLWLTLTMAKRVRAEGRGVIWYIHPREIDPHHLRLRMPLQRRIKSYVNLRSTEKKLKAILQKGSFCTFGDLALRLTASELAIEQ